MILTEKDYKEQMARSLEYSAEDFFFNSEMPDDIEVSLALTERFLESGGCLWGYPPFEQDVFNVLEEWGWSGQLMKVCITARSLLGNLSSDCWQSTRETLTNYANGEWEKLGIPAHCNWPGKPEVYLQNWNWRMHEFASRFWEEKRRIKEARMDLIFTEKCPNWPKK